MLILMLRSALFAFVGLAFFVYWVVADPSFEESADQSEWSYVLAFSGVILLLAFAVPTLAQLVGGRLAFRVSLVAAAGATLSSVANIFEDGLQMSWVFFVFILGTAFIQLGLVALTGVIAFTGRGGYRLLALVPAGTIAAIIFFVVAGGPIMLVSWLTAAMLALALPTRAPRRPRAERPRRAATALRRRANGLLVLVVLRCALDRRYPALAPLPPDLGFGLQLEGRLIQTSEPNLDKRVAGVGGVKEPRPTAGAEAAIVVARDLATHLERLDGPQRIHAERTAGLLPAIRAVATPDMHRVTANAVANRPAETSARAYSWLHERRCYAALPC